MRYRNGSRNFDVDFNVTDNRDYVKVVDISTKVVFFLPKKVILDMKYIFSWDRYEKDLDKQKVLDVLEKEYKRLSLASPISYNIVAGKSQIFDMIKNLRNEDA